MAVTVPPEMRAYVESAGLVSVPYGRDWQAQLLGDEDFARMLQNPVSAIPQAVEYVAQVVAEKNTTLVSLTDGADLLVAGMTEQVLAANVAEYRGIPLAALHFFPSQILQPGSPQGGATTHAERAQRQALGLPDEPDAGERPLEIQAYDELCLPALAAEWADRRRSAALRRGADAGVADGRRRRGAVVDRRWTAAGLLRLRQHADRMPR